MNIEQVARLLRVQIKINNMAACPAIFWIGVLKMNNMNVIIGILLYGATAMPAFADCTFPAFNTLQQSAAREGGADRQWVQLSAEPIATLELPASIFKMGISPSGSLVFLSEDALISGGIVYETSETVGVHEAGAEPASFFSAIFRGKHDAACVYSDSLHLGDQDYRTHLVVDAGEIFAFGKGMAHHFFILSQSRPDLVINGSMQGVDEELFRTFLSRIQIK